MIEVARTVNGEIRQGFAGDTANTAVYLARLLGDDDVAVAYVSALGNDAFSDTMIDNWQSEGIDTSMVRRIDGALPGLYWIGTGAGGERSFYYWRNDSAARQLLGDGHRQNLQTALTGYDVVFLSGISLAILSPADREELQGLLQQLQGDGTRIVFDGNHRAPLWPDAAAAGTCYDAILGLTSMALFSIEDAERLWPDDDAESLCRRIAGAGAEEVVLRRGAQPCLVLADGTLSEVASPVIAEAVDTTAAGDAFDAAYVAARLADADAETAALAGHRLAARVVACSGALLCRDETPRLAGILD